MSGEICELPARGMEVGALESISALAVAISSIDVSLKDLSRRKLVSSAEALDMLFDVRAPLGSIATDASKID